MRLRVSGHRDPGEIAFDIGGENRGSRARKPFRENLQGYGLAGAGGARYQAMAIGERGQQHQVGFVVGLFRDQHRLGHFLRYLPGQRLFESEGTPGMPLLSMRATV